MSMSDDVDRPVVGLPRALRRLRGHTFTGRAPENLVTVVVDADCMVERIEFAATITGRRPQAVSTATLAAIDDARRRSIGALMELAEARDSAAPSAPSARDGIIGGP